MRFRVLSLSTLLIVSLSAMLSGVESAQADSLCAIDFPDFDNDHKPDSFFATPSATADGVERAGLVRVEYGDGRSQTLSQATPNVPGAPESGDRFGEQMVAADYNDDGCTDLVVGAPFEAIGDKYAAGMVWVFLGGSTELASTASSVIAFNQDSPGFAGKAETNDLFGYSLAADWAGNRFGVVAIGSPGENEDAGSVYLLKGQKAVVLHQDTEGIPGVREYGDSFGYSIGLSNDNLVVGVPGEGIGDHIQAGIAQVLRYQVVNGTTPRLVSAQSISQASPGVSGAAETGDFFGTTVAASAFGNGDAASHTLFAVGTPDEAVGGLGDSVGMVHVFTVTGTTITQKTAFHQDTPGVEGVAERSDAFGGELDLDSRGSRADTTLADLHLLVGVNEDHSDGETAGFGEAIQIFPMAGELSDGIWLGSSRFGLPIDANIAILQTQTSPDYIWVDSMIGVQYGVPWRNVLDGAQEPVRVLDH